MRYNNSNKIIVISVICNILLCILKSIVGIISNSQALIVDSAHSFEDASSSIISLIGNNLCDRQKNNFDCYKAKSVISLTISVLMIIIALSLLKNVFINIFKGYIVVFNMYSLFICVITIMTKIILYFISRKEYNKTKNILIKSLMYDHRNDIIITISVISSLILSKYNLYVLDYIVGVIIAIIILITGSLLYIENYKVLSCINKQEKD